MRFMTAELREVLRNVHVNLPLFMFDQYFECFVKNGVNPEIGLDCDALDNVSLDQLRDYAAILRAADLNASIHAPFMGLTPHAADTRGRRHAQAYLTQTLKIVEIFAAKHVAWHTCLSREAPYGNAAFVAGVVPKLMPVCGWFAKELDALGARLMLENVYERDCNLHLRLLKALEPYSAGFCLDTGHSSAFSQKPLSAWLNGGLAPYLGEIHLHDNDGSWDAHLGAGAGCVNFAPLLEHLRALPQNLKPLLTLEPHTPRDLLLSLNFVKNNILF